MKNQPSLFSDRKFLLFIFFLCVIASFALFLRLINLTIIPVFADEAIYIRWAQIMKAVPGLRFVSLDDGKQPLFMWVVIPFFKVLSDPLFAGRIVSVLSGVGTILGVGVLSFLLFSSKRVALISAFLLALSPFAFFFDRMALADSMLMCCIVWAYIFIVLTVKLVRLDTAMIAGFFLGSALLTKSPAFFFLYLMPSALIFVQWRKTIKENLIQLIKLGSLLGVTCVLSYSIYNILRLGPNFHMISLRNADYVYPIHHIFQSPLDPLKPHMMAVFNFYSIWGPVTLILFVVLGIIIGSKKRFRETFFLSLLGLVPMFVVAEYSKTMTARYVLFSIPFFVLLTGIPFLYKKYEKIFYALLVVTMVISLTNISLLLRSPQEAFLPESERSGYLEEWTSGYGIYEVADYLRNESRNSTQKIVVGTEGHFGTLPDGLQIYLNDLPQITIVGVGQPLRSLPDSLNDSYESGNKTYLVVNSTRLLEDPSRIGLREVKSFEKAQRKDGSREKLLLLEVVK